MALFSLASAWVAAFYAFTFLYFAISFEWETALFVIVVLLVGLVVASFTHALHFGLFHKAGFAGFSATIRDINDYFSGNRTVMPSRVFLAMERLPRINFISSLLYSLSLALVTIILYFMRTGAIEDIILFALAGVIACLIYAYSAYAISEYFIGPVKTSIAHGLYLEDDRLPRTGMLTIGSKMLPVIILVFSSMILLTLMLRRTDDIMDHFVFILYSMFTIGSLIIILVYSLRLDLRRINISTTSLAEGEEGLYFPIFRTREFSSFAHHYNRTAREIRSLRTELEEKVRIRTGELSQANDKLTATLNVMEAMNDDLVQANRELKEAQEMARRDMRMATSLQESLFPLTPPNLRGWDLSFTFRPMSGVSGDMYDFYIDGDRLEGVVLFDVSGHGIASGLVTMIARTIMREKFEEGRDRKLSEIVKDFNQALTREIGEVDYYLTGLVLRIKGSRVEYINAAHPDILHKRGNTIRKIHPGDEDFRGFMLGGEGMEGEYRVLKFDLEAEDALLLYTDCLTESKNEAGEEYGESRLIRCMKKCPAGTASHMLEEIMEDFYRFCPEKSISDDLTAIMIRKSA